MHDEVKHVFNEPTHSAVAEEQRTEHSLAPIMLCLQLYSCPLMWKFTRNCPDSTTTTEWGRKIYTHFACNTHTATTWITIACTHTRIYSFRMTTQCAELLLAPGVFSTEKTSLLSSHIISVSQWTVCDVVVCFPEQFSSVYDHPEACNAHRVYQYSVDWVKRGWRAIGSKQKRAKPIRLHRRFRQQCQTTTTVALVVVCVCVRRYLIDSVAHPYIQARISLPDFPHSTAKLLPHAQRRRLLYTYRISVSPTITV